MLSSFVLLGLASPLPKFEEIITIEENFPEDDSEIKEVTVTIVGQEGDDFPIPSLYDLSSPLSEFEDIIHSRPGHPLSSIIDKMEQALTGMPGPFLGPFTGSKSKSPLSYDPFHMIHGKGDNYEKLFDDFNDVFEPLASEEAMLSFIDDVMDSFDNEYDEQDSNIEHDVDTQNNSTSSVFEDIESLIEKPQKQLIDDLEKLVMGEVDVDEAIIISGPTKPTNHDNEHQTASLTTKILKDVFYLLMICAILFSSALSAFVWIKYLSKKPHYSQVPNTEDEETENLING
ncbi:13323_t:CDS:1 [Ambispora leptoticha]|uniref:13323_t:CDS:1 n=1 Tax=Ambispora leptoticha TaxID=144679 RepID=A0A9N9BXT8_9GLOM|nr:13323_t:CDS:1 [Ambispora leptoticha]